MRSILIFLDKVLKRLLFVDWTGYNLNYKSIDYVVGHYRLYDLIKDVPGHIIEFGTGSGRNSLIFGNIIKLNNQEKYKKIYGFDKAKPNTSLQLFSRPHDERQFYLHSRQSQGLDQTTSAIESCH